MSPPITIICVRDPDCSNTFSVWPIESYNQVKIIDIDLGAADLGDPDEFLDWATTQFERAEVVDREDVTNEIFSILEGAIDQFGHDKRWITVDHLRDATKAER